MAKDWTPEECDRLAQLVADNPNLRTGELAARFGVSRNSIIGKLHRLGIVLTTPRETAGMTAEERAERHRQQREASRIRVANRDPSKRRVGNQNARGGSGELQAAQERSQQRGGGNGATRAPTASVRVPVAPAKRYGRVVPCCWPIGEPGRRDFRFCDDKSLPGKPYCGSHAQIAYVRVHSQAEDAA